MRTLSFLLLLTALVTTPPAVIAESMDAGRGNVELTVPASYSDQSAAPLIVLIHGFGGSGAGIDEYLKLSPLADQYGFILGQTRRNGYGRRRFWNEESVLTRALTCLASLHASLRCWSSG